MGLIEEQVYATSEDTKFEVIGRSRIICDMERTFVVWVWEDD